MGSKSVWNFSENSSVLVFWPVRGKRFNHWKTKQLFLKLVVICNSQERYRWHNVLQRMTSVTHVSLSASAPHAWFCWHIDHCPTTMSVHLLPKNITFSCPWEQRLSMKSGQRVWKDLLSHCLKEYSGMRLNIKWMTLQLQDARSSSSVYGGCSRT